VLQMAAIDVEVLEILRGQHDVAMQSHQDLAQATEEIADLHRTMRTILEQASMTQQKVDVICKDIRAMDNAKRNLTQSITILENFGTLTDALADLKETGSDRCALPSGFFFFFSLNGVAIYALPGQTAFCGMLMRACWRKAASGASRSCSRVCLRCNCRFSACPDKSVIAGADSKRHAVHCGGWFAESLEQEQHGGSVAGTDWYLEWLWWRVGCMAWRLCTSKCGSLTCSGTIVSGCNSAFSGCGDRANHTC
jgi:hypothetical protein